jgi:two-component system KDP operon response regulator KdpE
LLPWDQANAITIIVVDEDPALRRLLRRDLTAVGYRVHDLPPDADTLCRIAQDKFDLLILDVTAIDRGAVIRNLRQHSPLPIVALSADSREEAVVHALEAGADDYIVKPFGTKELVARVDNALRRIAQQRGASTRVTYSTLDIDLLHRRVRVANQDVHLPPKSYDVLHALAQQVGQVRTHEEILAAVWGPRPVTRDYLRNAIKDLRCRLEADPKRPVYILTAPRVGYRLRSPSDP